jgi:hypothetical protein
LWQQYWKFIQLERENASIEISFSLQSRFRLIGDRIKRNYANEERTNNFSDDITRAKCGAHRTFLRVWRNRPGGEKCSALAFTHMFLRRFVMRRASAWFSLSQIIRCIGGGGGVVSLSLPVQRARVRARVTSESDSRDILILSGGSSAAASLLFSSIAKPGGKQKFRPLQKAGAAINDAVNLGFLLWRSVQDVHATFWPFTEFFKRN